MSTNMEEFYRKYSRPRMENITVGFSGIDPAPKSILNPETPDETQAATEFVDNCIGNYFSGNVVNFDSGEIT